jgi:hypothetical protein
MDIRITHVIDLSPALLSALMSAASGGAIATATTTPAPKPSPSPAPASSEVLRGEGSTGDTGGAAVDTNDVDAAGWPWSPELHAATKGKTKDGLWRMKVGVTRPDPKPGFPKADAGNGATGTASSGEAAPASGTAQTGTAGPATDAAEDDEFAAFRAAAANADANDAAAAASVPARKWTDADLGALCNQAAVKLGDPAPVKEVIGRYVPEGQVAHSRNVPEDKRAAFAAEVEKVAGITFAG